MGAKYQIGRPTQDVRLRNWPAGRVAQFKKAIELLEGQLNQTMAAQVNQGDKRVQSARVPKVTGITVRSGFKNFQISFNAARGIQDLLFYEIQKSNTSNFALVTTYKIPQTSITIPVSGDRERIFVRVRCINSKFEVGPWSSTGSGQGSSSFRIAITRTSTSEVAIAPADFDTWQDVGSIVYAATSCNQCIHLHAGVHAYGGAYFPTHGAGGSIDHVTEPSVVLRILKDGVVIGNGQLNANTIGFVSRSAPSTYTRVEQFAIGVLMTKFETFDGTEGDITYTIQAKVLNDSFAWNSVTPAAGEPYLDSVGICLDLIDVLEVITAG